MRAQEQHRSSSSADSRAPLASHVALMITRRCNMACGHCSVESSPRVKGEPTEDELLDRLRQAAASGVRSVLLTGGEPMLRERLLIRLLRECKRLGMHTSVTTNGFWGRTQADAHKRLRLLHRAGLGRLTVSYDRYHAEFQGHTPALNISDAADRLGVPLNISVVRTASDTELVQIILPFESRAKTRLRFYDVQPVGRARTLPLASLRAEDEGFCNACSSPAITDDGRVVACNGPSYFAATESPLHVGSLAEESLQTLLERHRDDTILDTIRTRGPARLRDELRRLPGFESFGFRERYHGLCDLCHHITSDAKAIEALRLKLAQPQFVAERRAARRVIEEGRRTGTFNLDHVNGGGACRVFLRAAWEGRWTTHAEKILGRADLDWRRLAAYLTACGLARPLLAILKDRELTRWAPEFFAERIKQRALQDAMNEVVQREALRRIAEALRGINGTGVLLKGAAVLALSGNEAARARATGDIDLYVAPPVAARLRERLLAMNFTGSHDAPRTSSHHLAPIVFQGVPVEIHTRIMSSCWRLPEREMLERARPLETLAPLATLDPEGMILHAGAHASAHLFSHGLKTAWDMLWMFERFPRIDWERLAGWVEASGVPRAFWVPVGVLSEELDIPFPSDFLAPAPADTRQRKLATIARRRMFQAHESLRDINPFSRNGVFLLYHDSWFSRARYIATFMASDATEARQSTRRTLPSRSLTNLPEQLRQAFLDWRRYRRALRRDARLSAVIPPS